MIIQGFFIHFIIVREMTVRLHVNETKFQSILVGVMDISQRQVHHRF